jgi:signal transduction histidine kinase
MTIKPDVHMVGNANAIDQILNSLLTNASKYSSEDSTIEIQLETNSLGDYVIAIKDQGQGISDEDKAHIFERFYRSAEVRGSVKGTGLGLAIADQLIKLMGGTIQVKDNRPQGSVFILTIPAHSA